MGLYSFYKIFKDVVKTILGNKAWRYILIIALILLVFIFCSSKVNAADLRPWNVYTNTTEFNWNRLTSINYVDTNSNFTNYNFEVKANEVYYLYNPNSNSGSLRFYCYVSNDNNMILQLLEHTPQYSYLNLETNYFYNGGYVDIPYNKPFTPQFGCQLSISSTDYELYMLDDKYSNIEAYNEIMATQEILKSILGVEGQGVDKDFNTMNGLVASVLGHFISNSTYNTIYFEVEQGTNYSLSFNSSSNVADALRFGYCSSVPSVDGTFISFNQWVDTNYSNPYSFTANSSTYFYVSYNKNVVSNLSLTSNKNLIDNINNQAQATRETMTDSSISQNSTDYSLPSDNTNDITDEGFGSIFDRIRSTFTSGSATPITVTIPFTNRSFTISKQSVFGSANLGIVGSIIQSFWWFVVSLFIVKDIHKKIEAIKSGNIEFTETTNIKEDIL